MNLEVGETYESPFNGRYITVLGIDKDLADSYTLAILWVDKTTMETEPGDITVAKTDVQRWKKVDL